jgi:hypothetical protein
MSTILPADPGSRNRVHLQGLQTRAICPPHVRCRAAYEETSGAPDGKTDWQGGALLRKEDEHIDMKASGLVASKIDR